MTGQQAITTLGEQLYKGFSIETEPQRSAYKSVYENFITDGSKGVLVIGTVGVGKSALMRVMQKLFIESDRRFKWVAGKEFKYLLENYTSSDLLAMYGKECRMDLYIDDIGLTAGDFKKYGNSINIISEIIFDRYELYIEKGIRTHISSNLPITIDKNKFPDVQSLLDIFGERVTDRLKEMCQTIKITGKSLRG